MTSREYPPVTWERIWMLLVGWPTVLSSLTTCISSALRSTREEFFQGTFSTVKPDFCLRTLLFLSKSPWPWARLLGTVGTWGEASSSYTLGPLQRGQDVDAEEGPVRYPDLVIIVWCLKRAQQTASQIAFPGLGNSVTPLCLGCLGRRVPGRQNRD